MINSHAHPPVMTRWLYLFVSLHVLLWTLAPTLVRFTLPMDALEGTIWGHQLEWGYDKNPFLNGWLTQLAVFGGGTSGWMIYLFSQCSVALCFWATWKLAEKFLPPLHALLAVLLLEGMQYYNLHAIDFNDNTLEVGLWALTILYFYQALTEKRLSDWLLTGMLAGLGMMAKYYTAMLLIPMGIVCLLQPEGRQPLKTVPFWLGVCVFLIVIMPHTVWLFFHDFVTLRYAVNRVQSPPSWLNHLTFPLQFLWQQFEVALPSLLLFTMLWIGRKPECTRQLTLSSFDRRFLIWMSVGPLALTLLLSGLWGLKLRAGWGQPLLSLLGIGLFAGCAPRITRAGLSAFIALLITLSTVMISVYCMALIRADQPSSANFPGRILAHTLTRTWHERYHQPLQYIIGPRWLAGNVAFYSSDRPAVYMEADARKNPWINEQALKQAGAIVVWDPTEAYQLSEAEIRTRFKGLGKLQIMHFTWLRNHQMPPVEISVAFLAPGGI